MIVFLPSVGGGGQGVAIYATPLDLPNPASVPPGTVASVVSDGSIRQSNGVDTWEIIGSTTIVTGVTDTDSLDLTLTEPVGILSGVSKLSSDAADVSNSLISLETRSGASPGLRAQIPNATILGLLDVLDTDSIDMTFAAGIFSSILKISSNTADAGNLLVGNSVQSSGVQGLRSQISIASIRAILSVLDTDSIDMGYDDTTGVLQSALKLSSDVADAGSQLVNLVIRSGANPGLRAQIADSLVRALFSWADSDSFNGSYVSATGVFSGDVKISSNAADAGSQLVSVNIENAGTPGLRAQIANSAILGLLDVMDTDSIDLTYSAGVISGLLKISTNVADANNILVSLSVQSSGVLGLRAQIPFSLIRALFTASSPLSYDNTTGDFSIFSANPVTPGVVTTGSQAFAGSKTFVDDIIKTVNPTNASASSGLAASSAGVSVTDLQSATFTWEFSEIHFILRFGTRSFLISASETEAGVSFLSDMGNLALISDAGTGIVVTKPAASKTITVKNRMGSNQIIAIEALRGRIASATAWA